MAQRVRGQETFVTVSKDGELQARIDSITSFTFTDNLELQEENFLGETTSQFDSIYKGTSFTLQGQLSNKQLLDFRTNVVEKAQRRAGGAVRIDIGTTMIFPNGDTFNLLFEDCSFGAAPVETGSREDFVNWTLEGSVSRSQVVVIQ